MDAVWLISVYASISVFYECCWVQKLSRTTVRYVKGLDTQRLGESYGQTLPPMRLRKGGGGGGGWGAEVA